MDQQQSSTVKPSSGNDAGGSIPVHENAITGLFTSGKAFLADPSKPELLEALKSGFEGTEKAWGEHVKARDAAKPVVPEKYNLKLPDNSLIPPEFLPNLEKTAKDQKLTQQQLDERVTVLNEGAKLAFDNGTAKMKTQMAADLEEMKADKVMGGTAENIAKTNDLLTTFIKDNFGQAGLEMILGSGYAYKKEIREGLYRLAMGSQAKATPQGGGSAAAAGRDPVANRYPDMVKK